MAWYWIVLIILGSMGLGAALVSLYVMYKAQDMFNW